MAFERFAVDGPLALLPCGDAMMLVWTRQQRRRRGADRLRRRRFYRPVAGRHRRPAGRHHRVGACACVPLRLKFALRTVSGRVALVGNAAQTMHPVAAGRLNLGLRDAVGPGGQPGRRARHRREAAVLAGFCLPTPAGSPRRHRLYPQPDSAV